MNGLATAAIGAFGAVYAGFDRKEHTGVDGFLDLPGEVDEVVEVVLVPVGVELVMRGTLCLFKVVLTW